MLTALRSIALMLDDTQYGSRIGQHAAKIARNHGAHLIGIYYVSPFSEHLKSSYARGTQAIADVIETLRQEHEEKALTASRHLESLGREHGISIEFRVVWGRTDAQESAVVHALYCDLVITGHSTRSLPLSSEHLLRTSGVPVLIIPEEWSGESIGKRIVLAWNGSREARRAIGDAMPLVMSAEWVKLLIVDAHHAPSRHGADPGVDIARYLARHNARIEVETISSGDATVAEAIAAYSMESGADLLVIGAYSHARAAQMLFGGVTRTLLDNSPSPMLVSR